MLAGVSRGIRLTVETLPATGLPLVGQVAAGAPILAEENIEDYFDLDAGKFKPRADYLLRVRGDSMQGAGILDRDLLAVHRAREASNGQIIVARIDNEVTVKRFRQNDRYVQLLPENPAFDVIDIDLSSDDFVIEGLGVGVLRDHLD